MPGGDINASLDIKTSTEQTETISGGTVDLSDNTNINYGASQDVGTGVTSKKWFWFAALGAFVVIGSILYYFFRRR